MQLRAAAYVRFLAGFEQTAPVPDIGMEMAMVSGQVDG